MAAQKRQKSFLQPSDKRCAAGTRSHSSGDDFAGNSLAFGAPGYLPQTPPFSEPLQPDALMIFETEILGGTVLVQAETRYYHGPDILHAWHWVKTGNDSAVPGRTILPKGSLMAGYKPEYMDV